MILKHGDLWTSDAPIILVTTNSYIKNNGALVMGRGAAKQARDRYPGIDLMYGKLIPHMGKYGFLLIPGQRVGLFQVKYNFQSDGDYNLIDYSANKLRLWIQDRQAPRIAMNFPGTGNGRLERANVLPLLADLPDSVEVHEL